MQALDLHIQIALEHHAGGISRHFDCDVLSYIGPIFGATIPQYKDTIEALKNNPSPKSCAHPKRLVIVLTTSGGVVECVEKMVEITRHHYDEVFFIVPDSAMSAGTIWCMSGDKIWMDYSSSLGPIDPQVESQNRKAFVPALGYIEKYKEFAEKSQSGTLTQADLIMLKGLDLAELHRFEQARDLSISLLKDWLVKYKFKNWVKHRTTRPGVPVTEEEKEKRAEQIAKVLSSNTKWHSHGRMIGMVTLQNVLRLEIDDYSHSEELRGHVKMYHGLLSDYLERHRVPMFIHSFGG